MATLTAEQSARLLDAVRAYSRLCVPVLIALATGMRRGEILALRWRNVDLDRAAIFAWSKASNRLKLDFAPRGRRAMEGAGYSTTGLRGRRASSAARRTGRGAAELRGASGTTTRCYAPAPMGRADAATQPYTRIHASNRARQ